MNTGALLISISTALLVGLSVSCSSPTHIVNASKSTPAVAIKQPPPEIIQLGIQPPISESESNRIQVLIRELAGLDKPTFGLNGTLSGSGFAPINSAYRVDSGLIMNHGFGTNAAFTELVKLGPKALPFLLEALDDQTPTKLIINDSSALMGGIRFAHELRGNSVNSNETQIIGWSSEREPWSSDHKDTLTNYTVKIGDACFVAVGQIVGRPYQAIRYQPSFIIIINSPTRDTMLAHQVRAIWGSTNPPQHLLDSLLLDFTGSKSSDRFGFGVGSAMRLLYYFPQQTTNLLVSKLQALDIGEGTGSKELIEALTWCDEPAVRDELRNLFEHTDNIDVLCASVVAMGRRQTARLRMESFLDQVPKEEDGYYDNGYKLLLALGENFGMDAKPAFERYLKGGSIQRVITMADVLERTQGNWSVELLAPYLSDSRIVADWKYPSLPVDGEKQRQVRACDAAARAIAFNFRKLSFEMKGEYKDLDAQIAVMRQKIAAGNFQ